MSLDTLNNGDSGFNARTKINAAIDAVNAGAILRGSGVLMGNTAIGILASPPPPVTVAFNSVPAGVWTLYVSGYSYTFTWANSDPSNGSVWIDSNPIMSASDAVFAFINAVNSLGIGTLAAGNPGGDNVLLENGSTGSTASLALSTSDGAATASLGGNGSDAVDPSGGTYEVAIIPASGVKSIKPIKVGVYDSTGLDSLVQFALKVGGTYYPVGNEFPNYAMNGDIVVGEFFGEWIDGRAGAALVARMTGSPPFGGTLTCWAVVEQR